MRNFLKRVEAYFAAAAMAEEGQWEEAGRIMRSVDAPVRPAEVNRTVDRRPRVRV